MVEPSMDLDRDALFLDLDGTLLDIAARPDAVRIEPRLRDTLARLSMGMSGALAIVSGRTVAGIDALLAPLRLPAAGIHGAELRLTSRGDVERHAAALPEDLRTELRRLSSAPGVLVEDKGLAVAIHYRLAPEDAGPALRRRVDEIAAGHPGVQLLAGKCLVEVKPEGVGKGRAIERFMAVAPFTGRRPVFAGDDVTDEDALRVLPRWHGIGIAVGEPRPGATTVMAGPAELRDWLIRALPAAAGDVR
jgi:trehalose 6-phosphate phosphatase